MLVPGMRCNQGLTYLSLATSAWLALIFFPNSMLRASDLEIPSESPEFVSHDGAAIFAQYCAHCHGSEVIEPNVQGLAKLDAEFIYRTLWSGIMREATNGLDDAQRWAVANFVAGINPDKPSADVSNFCEASTSKSAARSASSWPGWAPDTRNSRFLSGVAMTPAQVRQAKLKWAFVIPDTGSTTNAGNQPTISGGRLFIGSKSGFVYSLDAYTGCIHWIFEPDAGVRSAISIEAGLALFADYENHVYALDATTGALKWRGKADEQPSGRVNGNVVVHENLVYVPISTNQEFVNALDPRLPCCTFRGSIVAFDIQTGRRIWRSLTIDQPLQKLGPTVKGTMRYGPSGGGVWSVPTIDARRGLLYVGTSNQKTGPPVEESDAVIAFDLKTGEKRWVRSMAPERWGGRDVWHGGCVGVFADPEQECPPENPSGEGDRDIGSPIVIQTRTDGSEVLLVASKDGMLYALDPDRQGETLWATRVGKIMKVQGPSFGGVEHGLAADHQRAYVPISDIDVMEDVSAGALVAVDLMTGQIEWRVAATDDGCDGKPKGCHNSLTSPPTVVNGVVFAGANDGILRAYDADNGQVLWSYDTVSEMDGINGLRGSGGSISRAGATVIEGMFYQSSGYGVGLGMPGNVLFAFEFPQE